MNAQTKKLFRKNGGSFYRGQAILDYVNLA